MYTGYFPLVFDPEEFEAALTKAVGILGSVEFDGIGVRGNSDATFGAALAARMHKRLFLLRKLRDEERDEHGSPGEVLGNHSGCKSFIFVDDFVASGRTRRLVRQALENHGLTYIGCYLYDETAWRVNNPRYISKEKEEEQ